MQEFFFLGKLLLALWTQWTCNSDRDPNLCNKVEGFDGPATISHNIGSSIPKIGRLAFQVVIF